jgi:hypothetical protein
MGKAGQVHLVVPLWQMNDVLAFSDDLVRKAMAYCRYG